MLGFHHFSGLAVVWCCGYHRSDKLPGGVLGAHEPHGTDSNTSKHKILFSRGLDLLAETVPRKKEICLEVRTTGLEC